ncbi:hypothetical protein FIBSPDRAFT_1039098 [Athelia psychrophila]|uniref:Uncharacterized protein n=1 Tax=Athelia psychrophila TaxID=1759441 RepID=A0A166S7A7_9AGAM|nr:hypothetical protein FIBSPDRAFT_1039098 [Fibularhizoctonia sp. CBS 109695]
MSRQPFEAELRRPLLLDPNFDEALYTFGVSKIPKSDAPKMLNRTVAIPGDEENYVIALDVFHQLHCLNMMRQALAPDHYPMSRINDGFDHVDHCANSLRESLMCSVDITPNTWIWNPEAKNGTGRTSPRLDNMHTCRDFDKVRDWPKAREMDGNLDKTVCVEDDLEYDNLY